MGWYTGVAGYLHTARPSYEGMEIGALPQKCDKRITREVNKDSCS
jgi:hypothetical protein